MSTVTFRRAPRRAGPQMPEGELALQEPPALPEPQGAMGGVVTYLPMALSSLGMLLVFIRPGEGNGVLMWVAVGVMAVSAVAMLVSQFLKASGDRKRQLRGERRDYLRYLATSRRRVRRVVDQQRRAQNWQRPAPETLWSLVGTARMWERRPAHDDFAEVRTATGEQDLSLSLTPLSTRPVEDLEPLCAHALRRFIRTYSVVPAQPIAVRLRSFARVLLPGDRDTARAVVRGVLAQLAVFHSPQDLAIAVVTDADALPHWQWVKWLPHTRHPADTDGAGAVRLVAGSVSELEPLLGEEFAGRPAFEPGARPARAEPYTVIVLDTGSVPASARIAGAGYRNAVVLDVRATLADAPDPGTLRLHMAPGELTLVAAGPDGPGTRTPLGRPDGLGAPAARALALGLAPYRLGAAAPTGQPLQEDRELTELLGIRDLAGADPAALHAPRPAADRLRVPIGVAADGTQVLLDLKESAQGGMGPHGMLIGATGSGKSELLRTLVLSLALTHSSETLNLVLVDFKGGATFLGLDRLPHTSAVITNLADETALVDRMKDALHGELIRRQELLRSAGNHASVRDYEQARQAGAALDPLPTLLVVVDEFSELLAAHRDFLDLFVMIGRLGRSLGVHLLLASQRLDEARIHQLESHLSYRIGLRTFSAMESRGVLGVSDAYELPPQPGSGLLKNDVGTLTRFKAAYVSGPYRQARPTAPHAVIAGQVVPFRAEWVAPRHVTHPAAPDPAPEPEGGEAPSVLDVAVERLRHCGPAAHQVWLAPLAESPTLDLLLTPDEPRPPLTVPVGVVDRPFDQRRDELVASLAGAGGHVAVAGGPQSGKSTLLRTLICALALTHTPRDVQFYCLDFGGGLLGALTGLPHVGSVTGRLDRERVGRTLQEVTEILAHRERFFAEHGVESMADYRRRRGAGEFAGEPHGDVFLVVDGWSTVRQDFLDLMPVFTQVASRGLNFGVHLFVSAGRWGEITGGLRDLLGTRFELRLGDPVDSVVNMRAAGTVPKLPGRGLTDERLHFLTALPRLDGDADPATAADGLAALVRQTAAAWDGPPAPPVRVLPALLPAAGLPAPEGELRVPLGLEGARLGTLWHDFEEHPHLVVVGDVESGKTNALALVVDAVTRRFAPGEAKIMTVDYRRGLTTAVPEEYRLGYAVGPDLVHRMVDGTSRAMRERVPGPDIGPDRLRARDWWTGPRVFLVIDDHELVAGGGDLFGPLHEVLVRGAEIGLHVIVARGANGAGRALLGDPFLRRLTEANSPVLLLSCPPSEGQVVPGRKPRVQRPGRGEYVTRRTAVETQLALRGRDAQDAQDTTDPEGTRR
ncbi:type VII secretion protein EccCa [Streptomyces griseoviridis]|uniref:S-DNA-T family DNA segregation ATPase FtsK/SpoIIIE n=2 Tax=Streptomyces griseoviridis TaxID=45398 RepID=A0ABT9LNW9_STRGD|nr:MULTISPECIES: type VII secretion protein EccCa [Streptomyces]MDP9685231.1 S-DNA-T family DNA segregation ATPase FtsK/SpoIIIE [Streptomyces griseoviridis]GGS41683.1 type VII secretion protein EccC [Streptomyces niveoruber]GGS95730.1 type VII secretion protein EccC [Streptomyces griseoviridis]